MTRNSIALFLGTLLLIGCDNNTPQPIIVTTQNPHHRVDVNVPGVRVQVDKNGTSVQTPGVDVEAKKKD